MTKAILFDLDGVLIETERETFRFYQDYFKKYGVIIKDEDFVYKAGRKSVDFFNSILTPEQLKKIDTKKLTDLKREQFNNNLDKYAKKVTGGKELLEFLKGEGLRLVLASQNESRMIDNVLNWLKIKEYFEVILSLDDIKNKKPNPEMYFLAAQKINVPSSECIVIEDSVDGIAAAKNAKMFCIAFWHDYMPKETYNKADIVVKKLEEVKNYI